MPENPPRTWKNDAFWDNKIHWGKAEIYCHELHFETGMRVKMRLQPGRSLYGGA